MYVEQLCIWETFISSSFVCGVYPFVLWESYLLVPVIILQCIK